MEVNDSKFNKNSVLDIVFNPRRKRRGERRGHFRNFLFAPKNLLFHKMAVPGLCDHPVNKATFVWSKGDVIIVAPLCLKDFAVPPLLSEGTTLTVYSLSTACVCVFLNNIYQGVFNLAELA